MGMKKQLDVFFLSMRLGSKKLNRSRQETNGPNGYYSQRPTRKKSILLGIFFFYSNFN